jgi:hypothetical protein
MTKRRPSARIVEADQLDADEHMRRVPEAAKARSAQLLPEASDRVNRKG